MKTFKYATELKIILLQVHGFSVIYIRNLYFRVSQFLSTCKYSSNLMQLFDLYFKRTDQHTKRQNVFSDMHTSSSNFICPETTDFSLFSLHTPEV